MFVTEAGEVLPDSTASLRWADMQVTPGMQMYPDGPLGAEAAVLEASLDDGFGPDGRLWLYHETLPVVRQLRQWALVGVPGWERLLFRVAGPLFDDIAERLSDGRRFLLGDRFTAADLTFAALAAPMLLPERYGSTLPPLEVMPRRVAREVERLRAYPAGAFADRLYNEERVRPLSAPS